MTASETARRYLPPVVIFAAVIGFWEVSGGTQVLPPPSAIVEALVANWSAGRWPLFESARNTLVEALLGLIIGTVVGVVLGAVVARWQTARDGILPVAVAVNAIPIIAFAPIMNLWFGVLNPLSKAAIAAVLVFFPIFINTVRGLSAVEPAALELMRSYAVGEWTVLARLRIPNALPYFLTGLKVSVVLALIGAIVGEYFGGSSTVIGRIVVQSASALRWDVSWAAIILGSAAGIVMYLAIVLVERALIGWHPSVRGDAPA